MEVQIVRKVLDVNDMMAAQNRKLFAENHVFALNVMSSPGSGKTSVLVKTLNIIKSEMACAVIVGDVCTTNDADRLAQTGVPVVQVNTDEFGGDCHLAAHVIGSALTNFKLAEIDLLVVENIGNLVCPAEFDIGEDARMVVFSVTEGEDKPIKYPLMFRVCDVALMNKIDLLPYLDYDKPLALNYIRQVNPEMPVFELSAKTGQGIDPWVMWLKQKVASKKG